MPYQTVSLTTAVRWRPRDDDDGDGERTMVWGTIKAGMRSPAFFLRYYETRSAA